MIQNQMQTKFDCNVHKQQSCPRDYPVPRPIGAVLRVLAHHSPVTNMSLSAQDTKIIVLVVLLLATFLFSMLPLMLVSCIRRGSTTQRKRFDAVMSLLSCYAAGVFLATCLLDLFPDVQDKLSDYMNKTNQLTAYPIAEFIMTCGMFVILIVEQIVTTFHGGGEMTDDRQALLADDDLQQESERGILRQTDAETPEVAVRRSEREVGSSGAMGELEEQDLLDPDWHGDPICDDEHHYTGNRAEDTQSDMYQDPNSHSAIRSLILLSALSLHSIFEGLAVGLQASSRQVLQIFAALALHKSILAFSLGLNLSQSRLSLWGTIRSNLVFSITSPLGIGIGIAIIDMTSANSKPALLSNVILQGLACGTFLYIVFFEVLPHEFNSHTEDPNRLLKVLCLILGYSTVAGLLFLDPTMVQPLCQRVAQTVNT